VSAVEWYVIAWLRSGRLVAVDVYREPWPATPAALAGTTRVRLVGPLPDREAAERVRARSVRQHTEHYGLRGSP
jgi:hypothetical protein